MTQATRPGQTTHSVYLPLPLEVVDALLWEGFVMLLLEALLSDEAPKARVDGTPCKVAQIAEKLEEPYKTAYLRIVNTNFQDGGLSATEAMAKLASAGIKLSDTSVNRHRRGVCSCPRG